MKKNADRLVTFFHDYTDHGITNLCDPPRSLTRKALDYLYERNCRSIDCLNAGVRPNRMIDNQVKDWQLFLKEKGCTGQLIDYEGDPGSPHYELARSAIVQHLRQYRLSDAIICTTGLAAVGVIRGLADCSLRAGIDVKILSISSSPLLKNIVPSITSMEPPVKETLIEQAFNTPRPRRIEYDAPELFIGESTELVPPERRL